MPQTGAAGGARQAAQERSRESVRGDGGSRRELTRERNHRTKRSALASNPGESCCCYRGHGAASEPASAKQKDHVYPQPHTRGKAPAHMRRSAEDARLPSYRDATVHPGCEHAVCQRRCNAHKPQERLVHARDVPTQKLENCSVTRHEPINQKVVPRSSLWWAEDVERDLVQGRDSCQLHHGPHSSALVGTCGATSRSRRHPRFADKLRRGTSGQENRAFYRKAPYLVPGTTFRGLVLSLR